MGSIIAFGTVAEVVIMFKVALCGIYIELAKPSKWLSITRVSLV